MRIFKYLNCVKLRITYIFSTFWLLYTTKCKAVDVADDRCTYNVFGYICIRIGLYRHRFVN